MHLPGKIEVGPPSTPPVSKPKVEVTKVETPPTVQATKQPEELQQKLERDAYRAIDKASEIADNLEKVILAINEGSKFKVAEAIRGCLNGLAAIGYIADLPWKSCNPINTASQTCLSEHGPAADPNTSSAHGWDGYDNDCGFAG